MEFRTLDRSEREALLSLLDGWDVGDGWQPAEFFRRYVEDDPTFEDRNVHVALDAGRLVSCVQVFPRPIWIRGVAVPMGGVGTVYTDPGYRRRGLGEALLLRAVEAMRRDGMLLSLLFAGRLHWYGRLGWTSRPVDTWLLRAASSPTAGTAEPFDPQRDLADVQAIHRSYSGRQDGALARDDALWQASLANAGNPDERFVVARGADGVAAYARTTALDGFSVLLEVGRKDAAKGALADLLAAEVGDLLVAPDLSFDAPLQGALEERGVSVGRARDPHAMWRCLDAEALARLVGVEPKDPQALLDELLPAGQSVYWTADRF